MPPTRGGIDAAPQGIENEIVYQLALVSRVTRLGELV